MKKKLAITGAITLAGTLFFVMASGSDEDAAAIAHASCVNQCNTTYQMTNIDARTSCHESTSMERLRTCKGNFENCVVYQQCVMARTQAAWGVYNTCLAQCDGYKVPKDPT